jgi:hypothetical protein
VVSHHRLVRPAPVSEYGVLYSDRGVDDTIFGAFLASLDLFIVKIADSQWLHHRVRRLSQPRRPARRPLWASPRLPVRSGRVHRGIGRLRDQPVRVDDAIVVSEP